MAAGIQAEETKHHMKRRSPWHDYYRQGTYMLTMVVEGRQPLLGRLIPDVKASGTVVAQGTAAATVPEMTTVLAAFTAGRVVAQVELTALGKAIRDEEVRKISALYHMVEVWKLCIMPDHIHMIVRVKEDMPKEKHLGLVVRGFKGGCSRAWWRLAPCVKAQGTAATVPAVATVPAAFTAGITEATTQKGPSLFESGYNDKILLHEGQLDNWKHYLDDNPRRLAIKRLHPDFFTVIQHADIGEWHCQLVGNRFLFDIPQKVAVIVHGAYTDKEYADYRNLWLACGEAGGVLVSAAIATREKVVMREAMDRGYRIILVRENGFPPLYKPAGESFDSCFAGQLLQVSPWEYHMERRTISREQCLQLNRLVEYIVEH